MDEFRSPKAPNQSPKAQPQVLKANLAEQSPAAVSATKLSAKF